ncbi:MAG: SiaB family protein kinase [Bacteroidota bacterium]
MSQDSFNVSKLYEHFIDSREVVFSYLGAADLMDIDKMMNAAEERFRNSIRLKKRLVNILVESAQNLKLYYCKSCAARGNDEVFIIAKISGEKLLFLAGNYLLKSDFKQLDSRIKMINGLPKENLKGLYRGVLDYGALSKDGGAGLGFIDIAKKADSRIKYKFYDIDDNSDFFIFEVSLNM